MTVHPDPSASTLEQAQAAIGGALAADAEGWTVSSAGRLVSWREGIAHLRCHRHKGPGAVLAMLDSGSVWRATPVLVLIGREELDDAASHVSAVRGALAIVDGAIAGLNRGAREERSA